MQDSSSTTQMPNLQFNFSALQKFHTQIFFPLCRIFGILLSQRAVTSGMGEQLTQPKPFNPSAQFCNCALICNIRPSLRYPASMYEDWPACMRKERRGLLSQNEINSKRPKWTFKNALGY
ncbi:hypothetical protein CIHG_07287 [Coccidioides immitis H538.4]|uniref:Uncharacterized protein n=3 Tax=Coccidioides immitis TaxID=5501 RepID=A0A0J8QU58_COCIT|nr:hypothetical protein CIRG_00617 [Coccidioides immitis RMSCC 2394]KMU76001.1 hypothetical protein CISG_05486 [Coccidioides immitis RMSCC 3703]KMU89480.1 hypothetical protein CIHG_07287 [Coccidioides immitis H538.4]